MAKTPTRRLGRGLGAFLDRQAFDRLTSNVAEVPDDPPSREASVPPPPPTVPDAPVASPTPIAAASAAPSPPDESDFDDDLFVGLAFPDVELE
jgi:hypothetical protein